MPDERLPVMKKTNIESIRKVAKQFLYLDPVPNEQLPFFLNHPFFNSNIIGTRDGTLLDITDEENLEKARKEISKEIDISSLFRLFMLIQDNYHLTFLKYIKDYMSKEDFAKFLAYAWVHSENPNQDTNVSIPMLRKWFRKADRESLMEKDELEYYNNLPDEVAVYRGVSVGRAEKDGLSWTCNRDTAEWFAHRFDRDNAKGYLLQGKVKKEDVFAYFNSRGEDEILCDSSKIYDLQRIGQVKKETIIENLILECCKSPKDRNEIKKYLQNKGYRVNSLAFYTKFLVEEGKLALTIPDKPKSKYQTFQTVSF